MIDSADLTFAGPYAFQFAWGLVVLAAFVGWGRVVRRLAGGALAQEPDWGLLAGWGMALVVFMGGLLNLFAWVSPGLIVSLVLAGAALAAVGLFRDPPARPKLKGPAILLAVIIAVPLITRYAAAVSYQALSCSDDDIAYFPMIVRMLETGALMDPFGLRRLAGYGGQTFLQALSVAVGTEDNAYLVDRGVSLLVAFGLVTGFFRRRGGADVLAYVLVLLLVVLLPFPMLNSASHLTGLALFLTLFRTLDLLDGAGGEERRLFWITGLVVAGAASLRAHYLAAAAVAVAAYWLLAWARDRRLKVHLLALLQTGAAALVLLGPWMVLLHLSSGTPLYPVFRGTHRPDFENYAAPLDLAGQLEFLAGVLISPGIALFTVPVILYAIRRESRAGLALYLGALATVVIMAWMFTYSDAENIHRYAAPFLNAAFIATTVVFVARVRAGLAAAGAAPRRRTGDLILAAAVLVLLPVMVAKDVDRLKDKWGRHALDAESRAVYARAQSRVPVGEGILAVVSHAYALDFARNPIAPVDIPGAASPDPGMPFFRGPAPLAAYLKTQGITHVLARDFDRPGGCLYDRRLWRANTQRDGYREGRFQARYYLDLMANMDAIIEERGILFAEKGLRLVRLGN